MQIKRRVQVTLIGNVLYNISLNIQDNIFRECFPNIFWKDNIFQKKIVKLFANTDFQIFYMNTKLDISFPLAFPLRKQTEEILIRGQLGQGRGEGRFTDINSTQFWPKIPRGLEKISSFTSFLNSLWILLWKNRF